MEERDLYKLLTQKYSMRRDSDFRDKLELVANKIDTVLAHRRASQKEEKVTNTMPRSDIHV